VVGFKNDTSSDGLYFVDELLDVFVCALYYICRI